MCSLNPEGSSAIGVSFHSVSAAGGRVLALSLQLLDTAMCQVGGLTGRLVVAEVAPPLLGRARVRPFRFDNAWLRALGLSDSQRSAVGLPGGGAALDIRDLCQAHLDQELGGPPRA